MSIAKLGYHSAIEEIDSLDDESFKESSKQINILRENITKWMIEQEHNHEGELDE